MPDKRAEPISMSRSQLQRLLGRFASELEARDSPMTEAEIAQVADRLVDDLAPTCNLSGEQRVLNSNVVVKLR